MADFTRDFLIRIIADSAKARTEIDYARKQLVTLEDTAKQVGSKLGDLERVAKIDALGNEMGQLAAKTKDVDDAVVKLTERLHQMGASTSEIDRATSAFAGAQSAADSAGGAGGAVGGVSKLTRFGSQLRALPSMQIPGTSTGTDAIANVVRLLGALPPVALPVVAALGAVAAAFVIMDKSLEDARTALKNALEASNAYNKAVQELSTQQAKDRIAELEKTNAALKAANEEQAKAAVAGVNSTKDTFSGLLGVLGAVNPAIEKGALALLLQKDGTLAVTDSITANTKEIDKNQAELDRLTGGLKDNAFAANDAAEAEKKLASIRDQLAEDSISRAKRDSTLKRNGTEEQVQGMIDDLQAEQDALSQVFTDVANGARKLSDDELEKLHTQFDKNATDIGDLTNNMLAYGKANDLRKQQEKDKLAAEKDLAKVAEDITKADEKRASDIDAINTKTAESYRKLGEAYKQAGIEAAIKALEQDKKTARTRADEDVKTKLERDAKISKVDEDTTAKLVESETKRGETLRKIRDTYAFEEADAIQNRDAVALAKAQAKRDKDTSEADKALKDDQKQIASDREKRLKDLRQDIALQDKEIRLARAAQDRETAIARQQDSEARKRKYFEDQNQLAAAQRAEILQRNNAYTKQISDLSKYLSDRIKLDAGYYGDVLSYATKLKSELSHILGGSGGSSRPTGGGDFTPAGKVPPSGRFVPTFDTGGLVSRTGMAFVQKNELILTPQQQRGLGGVNVTVNGAGMNKSAVIATVVTQLNIALDEAGAA